jgi:hypothetical protein
MADDQEIIVFVDEENDYLLLDDDLNYAPEQFDGIIEVEIPGRDGRDGKDGKDGTNGRDGVDGGVLRTEITFAMPLDTWDIPHTFTARPIVTVYDNNGDEIGADITFPTPNLVRIKFAYEMTGMVQLA